MDYESILENMQGKYRALTGFDADSASDIGIRLRVLAGELHGLFGQVERLEQQVFPQTATGEALERHAACRGLARKPASPAEGLLRFSRGTPAAGDTPVARGVICATRTEPQVRYETVRDGVLPAGQTGVDIPARAIDHGVCGNVNTGAVCMMVNAVPGITAVRNPAPFGGGVDEEGDEALRERLLGAYREIANGANAAFYYDIAMGFEKVVSAQVLPRRRGRGTVDVAYCCATIAEENAVRAAMQEELDRRREINVDVQVYPASRQHVDVTVEIAAREGFDTDRLCDSCAARVMDYVNALRVGQPLYLAGLTAFLMGEDGVENAAVRAPQADVVPQAGAVIRARRSSVTGMGA